jgi:hypothetical protein
LYPIATNRPDELTATEDIVAATVDPFIKAGVVQVLPLEDVAYIGALVLLEPTATYNPEALTVTAGILAYVADPFMRAGVVQVLPLEDVAYTPAIALS